MVGIVHCDVIAVIQVTHLQLLLLLRLRQLTRRETQRCATSHGRGPSEQGLVGGGQELL